MASEVRLKFLGIRALHDAPSPKNLVYGGNTNCIALEDGNQTLIFNAGFGINPYGDILQSQAKEFKQPVECHIFLSDFLWDSIMGIPLFTPVHFRNNQISIHSALNPKHALGALSAICSQNLSPFHGASSLNAPLRFVAPAANHTIGDWQIQLLKTPHSMAPYPAATWVFKHRCGFKIALVGHIKNDHATRRELKKYLTDCQILIQPAIAPSLSHPTMRGRWTFEESILFGREMEAEQTVITGIHPMLSDRELIQSEISLSQKLGLVSGEHFQIARESAPICLPLIKNHRKAV